MISSMVCCIATCAMIPAAPARSAGLVRSDPGPANWTNPLIWPLFPFSTPVLRPVFELFLSPYLPASCADSLVRVEAATPAGPGRGRPSPRLRLTDRWPSRSKDSTYIRTASGGNRADLGPLPPLAVPLLLNPRDRAPPGQKAAARDRWVMAAGSVTAAPCAAAGLATAAPVSSARAVTAAAAAGAVTAGRVTAASSGA